MARIGIDLGTTNSVAAWSRDGRNANVITNREQERGTPSVVGRHPRQGTLLIGRQAVQFAKADPRNTIFSIKRLMGRRKGDPEVEKVQQHVGYRIVHPDNQAMDMACVMIGEKSYSPIDVSAMILEKIKSDAEAALGEKVTHAVITVPAYFDDNQKEATRQAGEQAGMTVSRIVDEPTAAAYAFGMDLDPAEGRTILVYDLGGGTFDISLIFIQNGLPTVERLEGDNWLGGDNFDNIIIDYALKQVAKQNSLSVEEMRADPEFMWLLKLEAEKAKKSLGPAPSADIVIFGAFKNTIDVEVTVHRSDFESWIGPDIDRSMELVEKTLTGGGFTSDDIDNVLLVGGSTAIPLVRRRLAQRFGEEKIRATVDPMEGVALGASVMASRTEKKFCIRHNHENEPDAAMCVTCGEDMSTVEKRVKCNLCNFPNDRNAVVCANPECGRPLVADAGGVTAKPMGIGVEGDRFEIIIPKSTRYPTATPIQRQFRTVADHQEWIVFPVLQGVDPIASNNELQCEIVIPDPLDGPIPEGRRVPRGTPLDIGFSLSENGTISVKVRGKGPLSWLDVNRVVRPWEKGPGGPGGSEGDTVACPNCHYANRAGAKVCASCGSKIVAPLSADEKWKRELRFQLRLAQAAVSGYDWALNPRDVKTLQDLVEQAQKVLDGNDGEAGARMAEKLEAAMNSTCGGIYDLVEATYIYRANFGEMDQNQRLGSMLEDYKRRALGGEPPSGAPLQELRFVKIKGLVKEIVGGLGKDGWIQCTKCGKDRPPVTPQQKRCPECGFDPTSVGV